MKLRSWIYNIHQGVKSIFRNRLFSLASIATMTACLFLFGLFYALTMNINHIISETEKTICVTVFFDNDISEQSIKDIGKKISARSEVYYIQYTSAEEAWNKYKKEHFKGYENLVEGFKDDNPLANSASYSVYLKDITKQDDVVAYLKTIKGIRSVNSAKAASETLGVISRVVSFISLGIIAILILVAVFLISNTITIGITVRKDEISIMKLIGATDLFVGAPFIVEGLLIGLMGSVIPLVVVYFAYDYALDYFINQNSIILGSMTLLSSNDIFSMLIPITLSIGVGIGYIVSYFTLKKHIKV